MATITSTQAGEAGTGATWVGGVAPGTGDVWVLRHKVTITDTGELALEVQIGEDGELEMNASSADSTLTFDDHASAKLSITHATGILDLNGTSTYAAKILQAGAARTWEIELKDGTVTSDYGQIDYVRPTNGYIDITDATHTYNYTKFLAENRDAKATADRWYFKGVPAAITVDYHSEFEGIYVALEDGTYSFQFTEDPATIDWDRPPIYVDNPIVGRTKSKPDLMGLLAPRINIDGAFNTRANRDKVNDLEDMKVSLGTFVFMSPTRILESVRIIDFSAPPAGSPGAPYFKPYTLELIQDE